MYIKAYIFGMEMSQKIHFWYQIFTKNYDFLRKWQKKSLFWPKKSWTVYKTQFLGKNAGIA